MTNKLIGSLPDLYIEDDIRKTNPTSFLPKIPLERLLNMKTKIVSDIRENETIQSWILHSSDPLKIKIIVLTLILLCLLLSLLYVLKMLRMIYARRPTFGGYLEMEKKKKLNSQQKKTE